MGTRLLSFHGWGLFSTAHVRSLSYLARPSLYGLPPARRRRNEQHPHTHRCALLMCLPRSASCRPHHRTLFTDNLPAYVVPPVLFTALLVGLWTYKCLMTVIFQDKFIYMPYMPPFARSEKIEDYAATCRPVVWEHHQLQSMDGTKLAICVGKWLDDSTARVVSGPSLRDRKRVVICYFQGNGSSSPPRLPLLSNILKYLHANRAESSIEFNIIALSYRGYWKSSGRASQRGIEQDAQALLRYIVDRIDSSSETEIVLWGQSIGAGIASTAAAQFNSSLEIAKGISCPPVTALILETPFTSVKAMLLGLYPQKWLPYRYLWPFLWNFWDSELAIRLLGACRPEHRPKMLILAATRDEVVPPDEAGKLENMCRHQGLDITRKDVIGALHTEATMRMEGQKIVGDFILSLSSGGRDTNKS